jgi:adenosylhomocysteine nucleosidase
MKVAAITGLEAEARIARRAGLKAAASGGVAARTLALAEAFLADGADALLSFGIAGALAPSLLPGTLLLPRWVRDETRLGRAVDEAWRVRVMARLAAAGLHAEEGAIYGAAEAAVSPDVKALLFQMAGVIAIDLESHLVARVAAAGKRPFLVLRAVADPAARALPPAAVNGLNENGAPALGRVLLSVLREPAQIPALIRLAGDTRRALFALRLALKAGPI